MYHHKMKKGKWIDGITLTTEKKVLVHYDCSKITEIIFDKKVMTTKLKHSFNFAEIEKCYRIQDSRDLIVQESFNQGDKK